MRTRKKKEVKLADEKASAAQAKILDEEKHVTDEKGKAHASTDPQAHSAADLNRWRWPTKF